MDIVTHMESVPGNEQLFDEEIDWNFNLITVHKISKVCRIIKEHLLFQFHERDTFLRLQASNWLFANRRWFPRLSVFFVFTFFFHYRSCARSQLFQLSRTRTLREFESNVTAYLRGFAVFSFDSVEGRNTRVFFLFVYLNLLFLGEYISLLPTNTSTMQKT